VTGVDIEPQPHYPFEFHQADALAYPLDGYDLIHASPPCAGYSLTLNLHPALTYPTLIAPTRQRLIASGTPWVIENVVQARAELIDSTPSCCAARCSACGPTGTGCSRRRSRWPRHRTRRTCGSRRGWGSARCRASGCATWSGTSGTPRTPQPRWGSRG
jgi:hypothetical protein